MPHTLLGLDIGSNTFSFTELSVAGDDIRFLNDLSLGVRLSEGLVPGGPLRRAAVRRGLDALEKLARDFDLRNRRLRAVATAVLRNTNDPAPFLSPAQEILGREVEIISGREEAELTCRGAVIGITAPGPFCMIDIGGQSTEIGWQEQDGAWEVRSLDVGVVNLTERFVSADPPHREEMAAMGAAVRREIEANVPRAAKGTLLGVAGTATTIGMLTLGLKEWRRDLVHGLIVKRESLLYWKRQILEATAKERTERFGIRPIRADVFPAGICIQEEMLSHLELKSFTVSANGLRVGAALSLLD